jgi:two-component system sensor histidine kinase NblS
MLGWYALPEHRVILVVVMALSTLLFVLAFLIYNRYQQVLSQQHQQSASLLAASLAPGAAQVLGATAPQKRTLVLQGLLGPQAQALFATPTGTATDVLMIDVLSPQGASLFHAEQPNLAVLQRQQAITYALPLRHRGQFVGTVQVKFSNASLQTLLASSKPFVALPFLLAWVLAVLFSFCISYLWSKHLSVLVQGVRRLSSGDFGFKIDDQRLWGQVRQLALAFNDMSARLKVYEDQNIDTLTLERNKLESILLSIADGVLVCDDENHLVMLNHAARTMLDVDPANTTLLHTPLTQYVSEAGQPTFVPVLEAYYAYRQGEGHPPTQQANSPYFTQLVELPRRALRVIISPIVDAGDNPLGFVMIMHDVTKEREVDKLKTGFISNVSHELRTPVTTIKSYVDTLYQHKKDLDSATAEEFLEILHTETERLKKLVNDILDFSRLDEGSVPLHKEWEEIGPIVALTVQSIKVLAQNKQLSLSTAIESGLPPVWVHADSMERVLRNLLANAINYTPAGGRIKVRAELVTPADVEGTWLEVAVEDTGVGLSPAACARVFDRFYRVENEVHTVKGTGLGLHLVKVAVEGHHDGHVFVHSELGKGSTFGFRLPLHPPA